MIAWADIWKIVSGIIVSLGGASVIVLAIIKFSSNILADALAKKYQYILNEKLETHKSKLENKKYITKTKFDAEFQLYRELSTNFCQMVKDISIMIPQGFATYPANKEEKKKYEDKLYQVACTSTVNAQDSLFANTAFIPSDFCDGYEEILKLCRIQISAFEHRYNVLSFESQEEKERLLPEDYKRTGEINNKWKELNNQIREYLATLDVLD